MSDRLDDESVDRLVEEFDDELIETDEERELDATEPGAEGPFGTGIEGADDILEAEREAGEDPDEYGETGVAGFAAGVDDPTTAAEQGNRPGDEMVSEGTDNREVDQLGGDTENVDALDDDGIRRTETVDGVTSETLGATDDI